MLGAASAATEKWQSVTLAVKISGIHWWRFTSSRAAEATAGYYISSAYNSYAKIAAMLKEFEAVLDFTCLEMRTFDQPFLRARCGPYQLVKEVFKNARDAGVRVAGENALERYDLQAYNQIVKAFRHVPIEHAYGFTMLRLGKALLEDDHMALFKQFVLKMKKTC
jgi:beta-amylase